jgi:hypothetical protein
MTSSGGLAFWTLAQIEDLMKLTDLKEGDKLVADDGFTCLADKQICEVVRHPDGNLCVMCANGFHCLDGQLDEQGDLVGFTGVS